MCTYNFENMHESFLVVLPCFRYKRHSKHWHVFVFFSFFALLVEVIIIIAVAHASNQNEKRNLRRRMLNPQEIENNNGEAPTVFFAIFKLARHLISSVINYSNNSKHSVINNQDHCTLCMILSLKCKLAWNKTATLASSKSSITAGNKEKTLKIISFLNH